MKIFVQSDNGTTIISHIRSERAEGAVVDAPFFTDRASYPDWGVWGPRLLSEINVEPVIFELNTDQPDQLKLWAELIANWGNNAYVSLPVIDRYGNPLYPVIRSLADKEVNLNIWGITTAEQADEVAVAIGDGISAFLSIEASRIADVGLDPTGIIRAIQESWMSWPGYSPNSTKLRLLWNEAESIADIHRAARVGCDGIIVRPELIRNQPTMHGRDLSIYIVRQRLGT